MKKILSYLFIVTAVTNAQVHKNNNLSTSLNCLTCHSCAIPTKENPCIKPCPRESMIRIDQKAEDAPKFLTINKIKETDIYQPVLFSHYAHAEMSYLSGGCRTCHHYNPPGSVIGCSSCHESNRKRVDIKKPDLKGAYHQQCINCHRGWSGEPDCKICHLENSDKKIVSANKTTPEKIHPVIQTPNKILYNTKTNKGKFVTFYHNDHVDLFGLECSDCHTDESCIKCHTLKKTPKKKSLDDHHKPCSDCHSTRENCTYCHSNKEKNNFDHRIRTNFDISKFHSKLSCDKCHTSKTYFKGLSNECVKCHGSWNQSNFDHKITGLALDATHIEIDCESCHKINNYQTSICSDCHDDKNYPNHKPGKTIKRK